MPGPIDCKVYVGNLGSQGSKGELEREFGAYGPLTNVWVARNPPGFAFVEFEDEKDARDAVRALDGRTICGVRARVELSSGVSRRGGRSGGGGGRHGYSNSYSRNDYYESDRRRSYRSRSRSPRRRHSRSRSRDRTRRSRRSRSRSRSHDRRKSPVRDSNSRSPTPAKERNSRSSSPQERRSRSRSSD